MVLVITDAFSKFTSLHAMPNKLAATVAHHLFDNYICTFGVPERFVSDQGLEFCNELQETLWNCLDIEHKVTTPYHPQCNSSAEVFNKTMIHFLSTSIAQEKASTLDWERHLGPLMLAYNSSNHNATKSTPFRVTFGYDPRVPMWESADDDESGKDQSSSEEHMARLRQAQHLARNVAHQNNQHARQMYNDQDALHNKSEWPEYKAGQLVYAWKTPRTVPNPKLASEWEEAIILTQTGPATFRIHRPNRVRKKDITINAKHLKPRPTIDEPGPPEDEEASLVVFSRHDPESFIDLMNKGYTLSMNGGHQQPQAAPQVAPQQPIRRPRLTYAQREARRLANHMQDPPTAPSRHASTREAVNKAIATSSRKMATRTVKMAKRLVSPPSSRPAPMKRTSTTSNLATLQDMDHRSNTSITATRVSPPDQPTDAYLATQPGTSSGFSFLATLLTNPFAQQTTPPNSSPPTQRQTFEQRFGSDNSE
jgi:hypothetical protein